MVFIFIFTVFKVLVGLSLLHLCQKQRDIDKTASFESDQKARVETKGEKRMLGSASKIARKEIKNETPKELSR
jgi:hypothetical protein